MKRSHGGILARIAKARQREVAGQIMFKYIPSEIDQILQPISVDPNNPEMRYFSLWTGGVIARLIREDDGNRTKLLNQIKTYRDTVFSRAKISGGRASRAFGPGAFAPMVAAHRAGG